MQLNTLDWTVIVLFVALTIFIGIRLRKQAEGGLADFFLGGRNLPWLIAGVSMVATTFAADTPLAVAELVAQNGISGNWLWWSFLTGGMLTTFFFARLWRRANILTELELISIRYGGTKAKVLRVFKSFYLGLFMNAMVIAWVNLALNTLLIHFFGIDPDRVLWITAGAMLIAVVYTSTSGLLGVAVADTLQFVVAIIGTVILAFVVLDAPEVGGMSNLKASLPATYFDFFPAVGGDSIGLSLSLTFGAFFSFVALQWWASWYPGAEPGGGGYIVQRMMSTRTEKDSFKASLFFQIAHYCLRPWPWIIVGLAAVYLYSPATSLDNPDLANRIVELHAQGVEQNEATAMVMDEFQTKFKVPEAVEFQYQPRVGYIRVMRDFLPSGLKGLLLIAFLGAYLSTISTQLNMGASFLVNDALIPMSKKQFDRKELIRYSRLATVVLMAVGLYMSTLIESVSGVWSFIMEAGAGLGAVLIMRWYWWRINAWSEIAAMIFPFVGYTIGHFVLEPQMGDAFAANKGTFIFTVAFTTVGWLAVTLLTKPEEDVVLESFVERVRPEGWWKPVKEKLGVTTPGTGLLWLSWVSAIGMTYGVLLSVGKFIVLEATEGLIWLAVTVVSLIVYTWSQRRVG